MGLVPPLEMDASQGALCRGGRVVVLDKIIEEARLLKGAPGPALHEKAAVVAEHGGLHNDDCINVSRNKLHAPPQ